MIPIWISDMPCEPPPSFCVHKYVGVLIPLSRGKGAHAPHEKVPIIWKEIYSKRNIRIIDIDACKLTCASGSSAIPARLFTELYFMRDNLNT